MTDPVAAWTAAHPPPRTEPAASPSDLAERRERAAADHESRLAAILAGERANPVLGRGVYSPRTGHTRRWRRDGYRAHEVRR